MKIVDSLHSKPDFSVRSDGTLVFRGWLCVPNNMDLKRMILDEASDMKYTVHPGSTKMYHNLKQRYWWIRMKKKIARYVNKCQTCQQVKAEHKKPAGKFQSFLILEWKWDCITMDFVVRLPRQGLTRSRL